MKSIAKLKDRARKLEQQEQWTAAIEAYRRVLEREEAGDEFDIDLSLANRIGDLHLRLGQAEEAVSYYVSAAEKYADAGFYNNAIALCNKALRHRPNRIELYLTLSDLCARQGFQTDARRWILEYADRQMRSGRVEPAFTALAEFADMSDDPEVRETLADHLAGYEHAEDALKQLRLAYRLRIRRGEMEAAEALADKARAIDPSVELSDDRAEDLWTYEVDEGGGDREGGALDGLETQLDQTQADGAVEGLVGFETTSHGAGSGVRSGGLEGLETSPSDSSAERDRRDELEPLPLLDDPDSEEEVEPLPLLDAGYDPGSDEVQVGESRSGRPGTGEDLESAEILAQSRDLVGRGLMAEALRELSLLSRDADRSVVEEAVKVVNEIVQQEEDDIAALQLRVDYAARLEDPDLRVNAIRGLADARARLGEEAEARNLYAELLEIDPDQPDVRAALSALQKGEGASGSEPGPEEPESGSTPEFSAMLTEFRAKVTDEPEPEDVGDHYDLGLAFKEMGLIDEAIAEFETELARVEAPRDRLRIYEELGQCHMQRGQHAAAVEVLGRALEVPDVDEAELLGIYYHLGHCYSEMGQPDDAREAYGKILAIDESFADVPDRMAQL